MITIRLSQTFIFVVFTLLAEIYAARSYSSSRYTPVLRTVYSNICPKPEFANGFIRMRLRGKYLRFECDVGFTLVGSRLLLCRNGRWNSAVPICVKPGCSDLSAVENGFIFYENEKAAATLFCDSGYKLAGSMYNYCNGTSWDRLLGNCRRTDLAVAVSCDFEVDDLCGWENDATHYVDWERSSGVVSWRTLKTGPKHDHTTGEPLNGHFMLVDSSQRNTNETARLISPMYSRNYSTDASFRFFYHMFGDVGTIAVYVKPISMNLREMLKQAAQFSVSGNQGNAWFEGCLDLEQQSESFQIVIQAALGMRYKSDIAIDDVQLISGSSCNSNGSTLQPVTESEDDIYQVDSCAGRCGKNISEVSNGKEQSVIHCGCNEDCNDDNPCCPDYAELCLFDESTVTEEDVVYWPSTNLSTDTFENYRNEGQRRDKVSETNASDSTSILLGVLGTILLISSIVMAVKYYNHATTFQVLSMLKKWKSSSDDAIDLAEDVKYLVVNDTISNFSEESGSVASLRLP